MEPLLLSLLAAAAGCAPQDPGAARYVTAVVVVGEPALRRELAGRLTAAVRCAPGFAPVPPALAESLASAQATAGLRCAMEAECLLARLPLEEVDRVVVAEVTPRAGLVLLELSLRDPQASTPLFRSARATPGRELGSTAAEQLSRLLAGRDPVTEAWARRGEDPSSFEKLAERDPAWRYSLPAPEAGVAAPGAAVASTAAASGSSADPVAGVELGTGPAAAPEGASEGPVVAARAYRDGLAKLAAGAHQEAELLLSTAIAARGTPFPFALIARGHARLGKGDLAGAEGDYRLAFAADGSQASALLGLAECGRRRGDAGFAIAQYRAFLQHPAASAAPAAVERARARLTELESGAGGEGASGGADEPAVPDAAVPVLR